MNTWSGTRGRIGQVTSGQGVSVENQYWADRRIPILAKIPARVRFLSVEPLLKAVDLRDYLQHIQWVIVGGESGTRARPMDPAWVVRIRDHCIDANVPFFFKQWGGRYNRKRGRELEGRVWEEMPGVHPSTAIQCANPANSALPVADARS